MVGAEVVVGYLFAWVMSKARRVGERADGQIDAVLDAGMDQLNGRLHALVAGRPGADAALERLSAEAEEGLEEPSQVTTRWLASVVAHAAERDAAFAEAVDALVEQLRAAPPGAGGARAPRGVAVAGRMDVLAQGGSVAAGVIYGGARVENPPVPEPPAA